MTEKHLGSLYSKIPDNWVNVDGAPLKHRVPARDEKRMVVEVDVVPTNGCLVAKQHVKQGTSRVVIYESELTGVENMVLSDEHKRAWERSERTYLSQLEAHIQNTIGKPSDHRAETYRAERERVIEAYGESTPSKLFEQEYPKLNRPLRSMNVVKLDVAAPETPETRQRNQTEAAMKDLASAILSAVSAGAKKSRAEATG